MSPRPGERIFVKGGVAEAAVENKAGVDLAKMTPDSLYRYMAAIDSLRGDGIRFNHADMDGLITSLIDRTSPTGDSLDERQMGQLVAARKKWTLNPSTVRHLMDDRKFLSRYIDGGADTLVGKLAPPDTLTKREKRRLARLDTTAYRYNKIFRDSIKLSPVIAISLITPGFSQFYNEQYWKIPILYSTVAGGIGIFAWQNKLYRPFRRRYDYLMDRRINPGEAGYDGYKKELTDVHGKMLQHDTYRWLGLGFSVASYLYFLIDGTLNYPGVVDHVKKATTLATVCPGAGQIYNKTYWKVPIVVGGFAALIYTIDWNNRGYQRFMRAYNQRTDGNDATVDEFSDTSITANDLLNWKNNYRRNRDLCIILTGLFYIVQLIDAHATAHMKTYDISDDLASTRVNLEPMMDRYYSHRYGGEVNTFGMSLSFRF